VEVDTQVAEKEKEDRKLEIYNRIEAKSFTVHRGHKFKKSDILSKNRRLRSVIEDCWNKEVKYTCSKLSLAQDS
jgi:hypothetical protein